MATFIARSGSFNNLKVTGLGSTVQNNVVTIDTASGQLYYSPASSVGITITNNTNGNLLTATGTSTIRGSIYLNIKDLTSGPTYPSATQAVFSLAPETAIASVGTQYKWVLNSLGYPEGLMTSSAYKIAFGRGLVTYENGNNVLAGTNVPALYLGNYNDTSSLISNIIDGYQPVFVIGSGVDDTNRSNALVVYENGEVVANVLRISTQFSSTAPVLFTNILQVDNKALFFGGISSSQNISITGAGKKLLGTASYADTALYVKTAQTASYLDGGLNPYVRTDGNALVSSLIPYIDGNGFLSAYSSPLSTDGSYFVGIANLNPQDYLDITSTDPAYGITLNNGSIKLGAVDPLPGGQLGAMAVSGSNLWFHNGSTWKEVNLI
jgi:hypothetical protein